MEVVPTGDGDDDGVVWFRCPQCQGFLPKLSSAVEVNPVAADGADGDDDDPADGQAGSGIARAAAAAAAVPADTEVDILDIDLAEAAALAADADDVDDDDDADEADDAADDVGSVVRRRCPAAACPPARPPRNRSSNTPRCWRRSTREPRFRTARGTSYEVGQCILHLAWNDCGVVVAKEPLPGGRQVIKCWFQGAGVVRLIENAPR